MSRRDRGRSAERLREQRERESAERERGVFDPEALGSVEAFEVEWPIFSFFEVNFWRG
jgi:hypothetical protein